MEYLKEILQKEKQEMDILSTVLEMIGNQQEFKNVVKKAFQLLHKVKGDISLVEIKEDKFQLLHYTGDKFLIEKYLEDRTVLKKVREVKKPYLGRLEDLTSNAYHIVLPIIAKEEVLGMLCIHDEQKIANWKEISNFLYLIGVALKYYGFIEKNKNLNTLDVSTGLYNLRHFQEQLENEIEKVVRYDIPVTLVTLRLADYKKINEKLGYEAGEQVMQQLAAWVKKTVRKVDMPVRFDKDTITILLSNVKWLGGNALANRLLIKIKNNFVTYQGTQFKIRVDVSSAQYLTHLSIEEFTEKAIHDFVSMGEFDDMMKVIEKNAEVLKEKELLGVAEFREFEKTLKQSE